ncbi:ComEC/Rec2 family competence protein [Microbacterium sp. NPDC056003]|uniref:ComEC/Rec2 family competence protein n=1 Tax=Microbacterium sp. NPDC056003 TaxID=3345676 RepID=UPI0035E25836
MPRRLTLRLVPVAAAAWIAASICVFLPAAAGGVAIACWAAALGVLAWDVVRRPADTRLRQAVVVVVCALALAAAVASHVALAQPARAGVTELAVDGGRAIEVRATVVGKIERRVDGSLAFDAVATRIAVGDVRHAVRVDVVVRVSPGDVDPRTLLDVGSEVEVRGAARGSRPGDRAVLELRATRGVEVIRPPEQTAAVTAALRRGLLAAVADLPGEGAGLVPGLAVGDTSIVSAELDTAMKESSLSHLTAVSGANCALVVGLAFFGAAAAGAPRALRVFAGLAALAGFVVLVTPEPSVVRAGVMAAIAMSAVLLGRPGAGMSILSLAVAVLLVADPWLAGSLGFALSAAATGSLLLFARPLARGLERVLPRALALALAVPLAAQLACGPLLVLIAPQVPLYGVVANLLAAPAAPVATVLGLAACLTAPMPWLQDGLAALAWVPAAWIAGTATTFSDLPGDLLPWIEGVPGAVALAVVGLAAGVVIAVRRSSRRARAAVALSAVVLSTVTGVLAGSGLLTSVAGRWTLPQDWTVLACDVGQGDAVLLRSGDAVALVDTGPAPESLIACLDRAGVGRIDLLVLTHFDLDHAGGVDAVVGRVGTVLHGPTASGDDGRVLEELERGGAQLIAARARLSGAFGEARWRVLWPTARSRAFPAGNDASIVLDVRGGGIPPTLLLGDLSASPQRALEASGTLQPPYAVVKVAHHGSADQDAALYAAAAPSVAFVTVGAGNDYGHPRAEILDALTGLGARIARTDVDGIVAMWGSGDAVSVWRERGG